MIKRRVFYSFHYAADSWRAATVRNIGVLEGNRPATDNKWEEIKRGGDPAIRLWIAEQMKYRSCTLVLVGASTAGRRWIEYEIEKSWNDGMGLAGIYIHRLFDQNGYASTKGRNPFARFVVGSSRKPLSQVVPCYDPPGDDSKICYGWIRDNLANIAEQAIRLRNRYA